MSGHHATQPITGELPEPISEKLCALPRGPESSGARQQFNCGDSSRGRSLPNSLPRPIGWPVALLLSRSVTWDEFSDSTGLRASRAGRSYMQVPRILSHVRPALSHSAFVVYERGEAPGYADCSRAHPATNPKRTMATTAHFMRLASVCGGHVRIPDERSGQTSSLVSTLTLRGEIREARGGGR